MSSIYERDKSTVFSIVPFAIQSFKPGLYTGTFKIAACLNDTKPERLTIGASQHMMYTAGKKQPIIVNTASYEIAKAVVDDFFDGQLYTTPDSRPGLCWVQGDTSVTDFVVKSAPLYDEMRIQQKRWFVLLVKK